MQMGVFRSAPRRPTLYAKGRSGFTLVELLTIISILAVLAGILMPVFARSKEQALGATCAANLRSQGIAIGLYMVDSEDIYPAGVEQFLKNHLPMFKLSDASLVVAADLIETILLPYTKDEKVFRCPQDTGMQVLDIHGYIDVQHPSSYISTGSSFWYNEDLYLQKMSGSSLASPSNALLSQDRTGAWHGSKKPFPPAAIGNETLSLQFYVGYRYNILYCDTHTSRRSPKGIDSARAAVLGEPQYFRGLDLP
jgi:competence protein ComGC